jgi:hypothetical protein
VSLSSGHVINLHAFGATVRLDDGSLAAVPRAEVDMHRKRFEQSLGERVRLPLDVRACGRGKLAILAAAGREPVVAIPASRPIPLIDDAFEARLAAYLRETEEWAPPDQPQPFERHLTRKRRRSAQFARD